jgi:hypothetical protein
MGLVVRVCDARQWGVLKNQGVPTHQTPYNIPKNQEPTANHKEPFETHPLSANLKEEVAKESGQVNHPIEARRLAMDHIEAFLQSASCFGVIKQMMALSSTDIAVLFLASKPAFILMAGLAVLTTRKRDEQARLPDEKLSGYLSER